MKARPNANESAPNCGLAEPEGVMDVPAPLAASIEIRLVRYRLSAP